MRGLPPTLKRKLVSASRHVISPMYLTRWPELYSSALQPEQRRRLFHRFVKLVEVEVEVHSYCNRTCWFCPNSFIDRRSSTRYLPERVYLNLLKDLGSVGYDKMLTYSRYNEPLADEIICARVTQARRDVPAALLMSHTNGDYLDGRSRSGSMTAACAG